MSLESAILEHAQALNALAQALLAQGQLAAQVRAIAPDEPAKVAATKAITKAASEPAPAAPPPVRDDDEPTGEVAPPAAPAPAPAPAAAEAVTYPNVLTALTALINAKGREAVVALLARHNVKSGKELKAEQYPAVLADARASAEVAA